jgi:DNA recombination protein RmuC
MRYALVAATAVALTLLVLRLLSRRDEGSLQAAVDAVREHVRAADAERARAQGEVVRELALLRSGTERLGTETAALATALRRPQTRGRWGEVQLDRVLEAAGFTDGLEVERQVVLDGIRPDVVLRLPGDRRLVIDAKVPLEAYLAMLEAPDDAARQLEQGRHARQVADHVRDLAEKAYWRQVEPSPGFVVMFVPGDALLDAALTARPALLEEAWARDVVLATPGTLLALLRTVAYSWRQERLAGQTREVVRLGTELHDRLTTFAQHLSEVGKGLSRASESYNRAVGSLEARVLVSSRRMADCGLSVTPVEALEQVTVTPREVAGVGEWTGPDMS